MESSQEINYALSKAFPTLKVTAMEETLTQAVVNFKNLVLEFEQIHIENRSYKNMLHEQQEKIGNQTCSSCDSLKKVIASKEQIFDSIVSVLNKLTQTKDLNLVEVILKQIYSDTNILTPPESISPKTENDQNCVQPKQSIKEKKLQSTFISPKKEVVNLECKDESVSEIEGTPTGRKSPIFQTRKTKSNSLSLKDKKKCPASWPTPENKTVKLTYPSPTQSKSGGRMRQGRLSFIKTKSCSVVDLTCSPDNSGEINYKDNNIECIVINERIDNDETIMPSPTSSSVKFPLLFKSLASESPTKFRMPQTTMKFKVESETSEQYVEQKLVNNETGKHDENSISLLLANGLKSPQKIDKLEDDIHSADESISLLQHNNIKKIDARKNTNLLSPIKRPLAENVNIINMQNPETESSMSILREPGPSNAVKPNDEVKRAKTNMAPVYKEPTVRKKAEKRALPGWSCDECKIFYDELYKDNPEMLAQKMDECSKHRGRTNPVRPKTPEGFWNPRWDVPQDTEEFNRRNNAI